MCGTPSSFSEECCPRWDDRKAEAVSRPGPVAPPRTAFPRPLRGAALLVPGDRAARLPAKQPPHAFPGRDVGSGREALREDHDGDAIPSAVRRAGEEALQGRTTAKEAGVPPEKRDQVGLQRR